MSETDVISFENVSKTYNLHRHFNGGIKVFLFNLPKILRRSKDGLFYSLSDVSFSIKRGEVVGFIGPNGAGKSTTLSLIAGVLKPNTGKVSTRGRVLPLLELGAGFHPDLTGRENIMLNGVLMGMTRKRVRQKMNEIIDFSELEGFIDEPVRTYSSGMQARLGFSVVSSLEPEILLIDEVLAVGDVHFQAKCMNRMRQFRDSCITMVFVSHSVGTMNEICDRVIWLDKGKVAMVGPAQEVGQAYLQHMSS